MKKLYNAINEDDLLRATRTGKIRVGNIYIKDKELLIAEAKMIKNTQLWAYLIKDIKYTSNKLMFDKAKSYDDMYFGKAVLYIIDILDKKLDNLSNIK